MNVTDECLALIAEFEGFSEIPYNDPAGHCTLGYGELLHLGNCTLEELSMPPITEEEGRRRLGLKAQPYWDCVEANSRPLNPHEQAALCSFCYNVGQAGYVNSSVRSAVNGGWNVATELARYVHGTNGITYPGLVRRRAAEAALFNTAWEEDGVTQAQYDELKAAIGAVLAQTGTLGTKIDQVRLEVLTQGYLAATGRDADLKARIEYEATAGGIKLP